MPIMYHCTYFKMKLDQYIFLPNITMTLIKYLIQIKRYIQMIDFDDKNIE